jgi:TPR repeat protein
LLGGAMAPLMVAAPAHAVTMDDVRTAIAEKRPFDAFQYLQELAEAGNPEAQYELGGFYHWGRVGSANFGTARQWYERAAKQGNVDAMLGLAVLYGPGQGVPQDKAASFRWLVLASSQQLAPEDAARIASARDDLAKQLTTQQIEAALAEARSFTPKPE